MLVALAAAPGTATVRADDDADRIDVLVAQLGVDGSDANVPAVAAELVGAGDAARSRIVKALDEDERQERLETALDALDAVERVRADGDPATFAFWAALDEARTRTVAFDAVLRAAVPDAAARERVEFLDLAAARVVDGYLNAVGSEADIAPSRWLVRLAERGPAALVRLLDAAVGTTVPQRTRAVVALGMLKAPEAVPHLVFGALGEDHRSATDDVRALGRVAGYAPPTMPASEAAPATDGASLLAWWDARTPRHLAAVRHLAHRVLLDLTLPGVRAADADEQIARLDRVVFGERGGLYVEACDDTGGDAPRLTVSSVQHLQDAWRNFVAPGTWRAAVAVLRRAKSYHGPEIGAGGEMSHRRRAYCVLAQDAPVDELAGLLTAPETVLRLYAFRALTVREGLSSRVCDAFERIARTDGEVETLFGCLRSTTRLGEVALSDLAARTDDDRRKMLELLLDRNLRLEGLGQLLGDVTLDRARRPQLRALADDGVRGALDGISRWHDPEDAAYFAAKLDAAGEGALDADELLRAIEHHGATETVPRLVLLAPAVRKRCAEDQQFDPTRYLDAVAASHDDEAEAGLSSIVGPDLATTPPVLRRAVASELGSAPEAAFTSLRWRLWEALPWSRAAAVAAMAKSDKTRAVRLALRDLGWSLPAYAEDGNAATLIPSRLALIHDTDPPAATAYVAARLRHDPDYEEAQEIAPEIAAWRDDALIEPLFAGLASTAHPDAFLPIARVLLAYDRPAIDERLRNVVAEYEPLHTDWGGKALAKLLADRPRTWEAGRGQ